MNQGPLKDSVIASSEVLKDQELANLLLAADEDRKNPFNSWSKFQILIQQGKHPEGIKWVFFAVQLGLPCINYTTSQDIMMVKIYWIFKMNVILKGPMFDFFYIVQIQNS